MSTNKYNISFDRLISLLLPACIKLPIIEAIARVGLVALPQQEFVNTQRESLFRLNHNGQVCHLRTALNSKFRSMLSNVRFEIGETYGDVQWVFSSTENQTHHLLAQTEVVNDGEPVRTHIYAPNEDLLNGAHKFIIYVPGDLYNEPMLSKIKQFVNQYRLVSSIPIYKPINS